MMRILVALLMIGSVWGQDNVDISKLRVLDHSYGTILFGLNGETIVFSPEGRSMWREVTYRDGDRDLRTEWISAVTGKVLLSQVNVYEESGAFTPMMLNGSGEAITGKLNAEWLVSYLVPLINDERELPRTDPVTSTPDPDSVSDF